MNSRTRVTVLLWSTLLLVGCESAVSGPEDTGSGEELRPVQVAPGMRFTTVGAGWFHTCATAVDGGVYCWGKQEFGELGGTAPPVCRESFIGDVPCTGTPQRVVDAPPLRLIVAGKNHTCGLDPEGVAWCWGISNALGNGTPSGTANDAGVPCAAPPGWNVPCRAFAAPVNGSTRFHTLHAAIDGPGTCGASGSPPGGSRGYCWGLMQTVNMGVTNGLEPAALPTELAFESLALQGNVACGLVEGAAWCWGSNWFGSLGTGQTSTVPSTHPVPVTGGHLFTELALTQSSVCGIGMDGEALCWGILPGHDAPYYGSSPMPAGGPSFVSIEGGGGHHCGLTQGGEAWCWGMNARGYLGDGTREDRSSPTRVRAPEGVRFEQLALGGLHTCGLATDGRLFCWGENGVGQVGRPPP